MIPLRHLVSGYSDLIDELYRWLYEQFPVLHTIDIEAVNALIAKTPGGPPRRRDPDARVDATRHRDYWLSPSATMCRCQALCISPPRAPRYATR